MNTFFEQYQAAFDDLDAEKITSFYSLPCAISDGDGKAVYDSLPQLTEKFAANCNALVAMEYSHCELKIISEQALGEGACGVTVAWKAVTKTSEIPFRAFYICHKDNEKWRIFSVQVFSGAFD